MSRRSPHAGCLIREGIEQGTAVILSSCFSPEAKVIRNQIRNLKASSSVAKDTGSVRCRRSRSHSIPVEINDANVTGGNVVNFERVGSNRKEMAIIGELLVICMVPTIGGADLKN